MNDQNAGKVAPSDLTAEASVLSAVMLEPKTLDDLVDVLIAEDFYSEPHRRIYEAALSLRGEHLAVDMVSVCSRLKDAGRLAQVGGLDYLANILDACPAIANAKQHAIVVRNKSRMRSLIVACQRAAAKAYLGGGLEVLDEHAKELATIAETGDRNNLRHLREYGGMAVNEMMAAKGTGGITGMETGLVDLDRTLTGLHGGECVVIAGRPAMGKSAFAFGIGLHVAMGKKAVAAFSLEMPGTQVALRSMCSLSGVSIHRTRGGRLGAEEFQRVLGGGVTLSEAPHYWIDETPGATIDHIRSRTRKVQRDAARDGISMGLVIVDYLQLVRESRSDSREQQVSEVSRSMKELAKEMNCPVLALSQLNRKVEERSDKRPMLSDLRDSGAIEQDADIVIFLYRDEIYRESTPDKGICEVIIAKQRNGPTRTIKVAFDGPTTTFRNLSNQEEFGAA
jgi:replicative DNA helicase